MSKYLLLISLIIISVGAFSQNAKRFYKSGVKASEINQYQEAITQFSTAIKLDSLYIDAYINRANIYKTIDSLELAVKDYEKIASLDTKAVAYFFEAGKLHYQIKNYKKALYYLSNVVILDNTHFQAYQYKSFSHIKVGEYNRGIVAINRAMDIKETYVGYYVRGVANDSLQNYQQAIVNYEKSLELKPKFKKGFFALTRVCVRNNDLDEALEIANQTIKTFPTSAEAYESRSLVYYKMGRLLNAINDLSKVETLTKNNYSVLFTRGMYYFESSLFQNAKSDFSQVIAMSRNYKAIYWRGRANEEIMQNKLAVKDYTNFLILASKDSANMLGLIADADSRLYEISRERNAPAVLITTPNVIDNAKLAVLHNSNTLFIEGVIEDESAISYLTINEDTVSVNQYKTFSHTFNIADITRVVINVSDVYNNTSTFEYGLSFVEHNNPIVKIITPYVNDDNVIYLESDNSSIFIQGSIDDESRIKEIVIGDERAAFDNTKLNPQFSTIVSVQNRDSIVVKVVDEFNNVSKVVYTLNRQAALLSENNPMGKTWVVFVENTDYELLPSLNGPSKDAKLIKSALSDYEIHNFIHKRNMTKIEMERFFSIQLRDMVKQNSVNSLLIWYAGHGKFINETGYWIPTDGSTDDEFSYFNINSLKSGMQSYNSQITHTLVVTDACESGPAFYMAMRSVNNKRLCSDETAIKFRSAQVFSSAGYELASDNSQFTKTFAKSLQFNTKRCIPIESIVTNVINATPSESVQKPLFGKISGFNDENGTFFFIRK